MPPRAHHPPPAAAAPPPRRPPAARHARWLLPPLLALGAACGGDGPPAPVRVAVASVDVAAPPAALTVGQTHQLVAAPRAATGAPLADRAVVWASEAEAVVTVTPAGVLTARSAGSAWVRATSEGRVGRAEVHVVAAAPAPAVAALDPAVLVVGTAGPVTLRVLGTGFTAGTTLRWNGAERATTVVSATELRVAVPAEDLAQPAAVVLTVHAPAGGPSAPATLRIETPATQPAPPPALTGFAPASVLAGEPGPVVLAVHGEGFTARSRVAFDGATRASEYVSATELRITLTAADVAAAGDRVVAVTTDPPGGGRVEARFRVLARAARVAVASPWGSEWTWPGVSLPLEAHVWDARDRPLDERPVGWRVGDEAVATLLVGGARRALVYGGAPGQTWVEATADGITARRTLAVLAAPDADLVFGVGTGDARALALWSPRAGGIPTKLRLPVLAFDPAPSPDGRLIAFAGAPVGAGVGANVDVYVVHRDGSNLRRLTTDPGFDGAPAWSPDGSRLAFVSTRAGSGADVWTMAADGSDSRRLTDARWAVPLPGSGFGAAAPAWSPDGTTLAYTVTSYDGSTLWTMRADGSGKRALGTPAGADDFQPEWSPDGQLVAVRRVTAGTGGASEQVVTLSARDGAPVWRPGGNAASGMPAHAPDGRWLALSDPTSPAPGALRVLPLSGPAAGASRIVVSAELGGARGARWIRRP